MPGPLSTGDRRPAPGTPQGSLRLYVDESGNTGDAALDPSHFGGQRVFVLVGIGDDDGEGVSAQVFERVLGEHGIAATEPKGRVLGRRPAFVRDLVAALGQRSSIFAEIMDKRYFVVANLVTFVLHGPRFDPLREKALANAFADVLTDHVDAAVAVAYAQFARARDLATFDAFVQGFVSALLRAKLVMGPHQEREFRVLDRIEACLRAAVQGRGELSGFLPPPDEGGRTGVLGMLPHVNAITGLIGRVNQHAALHPGIHIVHDQQLQFAPAIQAAVEQLQAISDRVVEATAGTKASEVEDWSVAGRVSLEFSDSRACRGIQAADVIARFCMQRMTAILSGAETDPFQAEPLVLLRDLRTRKPEVGVRIVASTRDANRFWES